MQPLNYVRPADSDRALAEGIKPGVRYIAGGTTLVDLMKLQVETPQTLVDLNALPLARIESVAGGLRIGALARNADVARHPLVVSGFPALSQALLSGASAQIRNMATTAGNVLQRTRCSYFRDIGSPCNKREPGSGCSAWDGYNRMHAVLGAGEKCIAAHPSDMCVALVALDATVAIRGPQGTRSIPLADFHTLPVDRPEIESVLREGELITHVEIPSSPFAATSHYRKVRDRASYAFALASAAVALELKEGKIRSARVALGGVATKPWRSLEAEDVLTGQAPAVEIFRRAAEAALHSAVPRKHNAFKIELAKRTLVRALATVGGVA